LFSEIIDILTHIHITDIAVKSAVSPRQSINQSNGAKIVAKVGKYEIRKLMLHKMIAYKFAIQHGRKNYCLEILKIPGNFFRKFCSVL